MCPRTLILTFVALAGLPLGSVLGDEVLPQLKRSVLIVDGVNNHDWERATRILKAILVGSGRFTVDVATSPPASAPAEKDEKVGPHPDGYSPRRNIGYLVASQGGPVGIAPRREIRSCAKEV